MGGRLGGIVLKTVEGKVGGVAGGSLCRTKCRERERS